MNRPGYSGDGHFTGGVTVRPRSGVGPNLPRESIGVSTGDAGVVLRSTWLNRE